MQDALYQIRGLVKRYGPRTVLDGLDFDVLAGESLVVLGRSGSGKSVTLRQLNGLEKPDAGTVVFDGHVISQMEERELAPLRRRIGMLFQGGALFDSMTVFENVAFPLQEHARLPAAEVAEKVREKLALVRLKGIEGKMPADLSGGMKKRVALARSLASDPEVLLFDEPTTGLDPVTSATIGKLIRSVQQQIGVTAVVVTHDLALTAQVADRVGFLSGGRFLFLGPWEEAKRSNEPELSAFLNRREEEEQADAA